jgi:putative ABC transport system substrate-binding protein
MLDVRRRDFIRLLSGAAATWPLAARAQQPAMPVIGVLMPYAQNDPEALLRVEALHRGLQQFDWADGRNVRIEHRWAASDIDSMRDLARELVGLRPAVILTDTTPVTAAVLRETRTISVIFVQVADPIGSGFVTGFPRPGGNATGFNTIPPTMASKWLELLMEVVPRTVRVMCLFNPPTTPIAPRSLELLKVAASAIGVEAVASPVHEPAEVETAIAAFAGEPDSGLIVLPSVFTLAHRDLVIGLTEQHRLPAVYGFRHYAQSGGLISYGNIAADAYRQAANYIDRILRGAKPADLPVQGPVKFELVVNLKTAKRIGLTIPESFLLRADEVIE